MLLDDGHVTTFLQTRPIPVGGRTGPVNRQDVPRQHLDPQSPVKDSEDPFTTSLLPVREVQREPSSVEQDTHDRPHGAKHVHPAGTPFAELPEAQPPSSAHARAKKLVGTDAQKTNHCSMHSIPACTAGSALWANQWQC